MQGKARAAQAARHGIAEPILRRLREAQLVPFLMIGAAAAMIVGVLWLTVLLLIVTWPWLLLGSVVFWVGFGAGCATAWTIRKGESAGHA